MAPCNQLQAQLERCFPGAIGLFAKDEVALVFAKGHLLSEEKGEPIDPQYVVGGHSDIPF